MSVLLAAILWGTTGTAAAFAPDVPAMAIGAVAMGGGGFLQALLAFAQIWHLCQCLSVISPLVMVWREYRQAPPLPLRYLNLW